MKSDTYTVVTERIIEALEAGHIPWSQPWGVDRTNRPLRSTGQPYSGVNVLVLLATAMTRGYSSPWWLTFNQARKLGGCVRKGESGTPVVFYKTVTKKRTADDEEPGAYRLLKHYTVFNLDQIDGVEMPEIEPLPERDPIQAADEIVHRYIGALNGPRLGHGGNSAYYSPFQDSVTMPLIGQFDSSEHYYSTLFHELAHSTGHESRLARQNWSEATFGSESYAREELVAEIAAAFLSGESGVDLAVEHHAGYIQSWLRALRDDKTLVIKAAAAAQKASEHVLGTKRSEEPAGSSDHGQSPTRGGTHEAPLLRVGPRRVHQGRERPLQACCRGRDRDRRPRVVPGSRRRTAAPGA
jgi:antirestriction protein ArdC